MEGDLIALSLHSHRAFRLLIEGVVAVDATRVRLSFEYRLLDSKGTAHGSLLTAFCDAYCLGTENLFNSEFAVGLRPREFEFYFCRGV